MFGRLVCSNVFHQVVQLHEVIDPGRPVPADAMPVPTPVRRDLVVPGLDTLVPVSTTSAEDHDWSGRGVCGGACSPTSLMSRAHSS